MVSQGFNLGMWRMSMTNGVFFHYFVFGPNQINADAYIGLCIDKLPSWLPEILASIPSWVEKLLKNPIQLHDTILTFILALVVETIDFQIRSMRWCSVMRARCAVDVDGDVTNAKYKIIEFSIWRDIFRSFDLAVLIAHTAQCYMLLLLLVQFLLLCITSK